jgi:hypothetical protein
MFENMDKWANVGCMAALQGVSLSYGWLQGKADAPSQYKWDGNIGMGPSFLANRVAE